MGFHNICSKADRAIIAYLISRNAGTTADMFSFKAATDLPKPPFTVVASTEWSPAIEGAYRATLMVKATVEIHTNAAPTKDEDTGEMVDGSEERVQKTGDALYTTEANPQSGDVLGQLISEAAATAGVPDFTCLSAQITGGNRGISAKHELSEEWLDSFDLELLCIPRTI